MGRLITGLSWGPDEATEILRTGENATTLIVTGKRGAGRSTLVKGLSLKFVVEQVADFTTRPRRPSDPPGEHIYLPSNAEFFNLGRQHKMLAWTGAVRYTKNSDGSFYYRGTPIFEDWPSLRNNTEIRVIICGPRMALDLPTHLPLKNVKTVFLTGSDRELLERIRDRVGPDFVAGHMKKNQEYEEFGYEQLFQHVVFTDNLTTENVLDEVLYKTRLPIR